MSGAENERHGALSDLPVVELAPDRTPAGEAGDDRRAAEQKREQQDGAGDGARHSLRIGLYWVFLFCLPLAVFLGVRPGGQHLYLAVSDWAEVVGPLSILAWFAVSLLRSRRRERPYLGPLLIAAGALSFVAGDTIWAYNEVILGHPNPFPSMADVGYLSMYPLTALGIMVLWKRRASPLHRVIALLDAALIVGGISIFSWFFVIGPTLEQSYDSWLSKVLATAYPVFDLLLIASLLLLLLQWADRRWRTGVHLMAAGLVSIVVSDTAFAYLSLHNQYNGGVTDIGWTFGYMLLALSAVAFLRAGTKGAAAGDAESELMPIWSLVLPYVMVAAGIGMMVGVAKLDSGNPLDSGVYVGDFLLMMLAVARLFIVIFQNRRLLHERDRVTAQLRQREEMLRHLAHHDSLTGLANRLLLEERLADALSHARQTGPSCAVLGLDLDGFKAINDSLGHEAGDEFLREIARRLTALVRQTDTVARVGGDEFVIVLLDVTPEDVESIAARLLRAIRQPLLLEGRAVHGGGSVGAALYPYHGEDARSLLRIADNAMYEAKRSRAGYLGTGLRTDGDPQRMISAS